MVRFNASLNLRLTLLVTVFTSTAAVAQQASLEATLDQLVEGGEIVAAQAVVGRGGRILVDHAVGVTVPGGSQKVDADTMFCIGSCSKPFASAVVMSLVEDDLLKLDRPVSDHMPAFGELILRNGQPSLRAPTMKELLTHRSGIYSQKRGMTRRQAGWIRNFGLTLKESVNGIAGEPLISQPGSEYAYSGAGYCVAGRIAEVAAGESFESLLQERIAKPLALTRTTYFPIADNTNVAAGGIQGRVNPATPHLTKPELRLPLIGGSLYSTAQETALFLRMVADRGRAGTNRVMQQRTWQTWTSRPYQHGNYGFGWLVAADSPAPGSVTLSHNGSLASSRSRVVVIPKLGVYAVVHYTVSGPDPSVGGKIRTAMDRAVKNLARK